MTSKSMLSPASAVPTSRLILLAVILAVAPSSVQAGGWTRAAGSLLAKLTYGASSSNTVYRFDGETKYPTDNSEATVRDYPLADRGMFLYGEYGILDELTVILEAAAKRSILITPIERRETEGLSDVGLSVRYRVLSSGSHVLSARGGIAIPTGYTRDLTPPLGNGVPVVSAGAEYGYSFYPLPAYAAASLLYQYRPALYSLSSLENEDREFEPRYADQVQSSVEAGWTFLDRILLKGSLRYLTTTRMDDNDFDVEHPPETERWLKVGGGLGVGVPHGFSISADLYVTPMGRKTANSTDIFIGLAWEGSLMPESP